MRLSTPLDDSLEIIALDTVKNHGMNPMGLSDPWANYIKQIIHKHENVTNNIMM